MAKGNKALSEQMTARDKADRARYEDAAGKAETKGVAEQGREDEYVAHQAWKKTKDYTKPPPGLISMNYADPAQRQRMRERTMNSTPTGTAAWGAEGNATAIGLAKQNMLAHQDEDAASSYESDVRAEDTYQRTGAADSLIASDWARKSGLLASASGMSQFGTQARINTQPKSILPALLSAGLGAAGTALSGGFAAGGAFGSDSRLKENVERLEGVHAVAFNWNDSAAVLGFIPGERVVGLMADDVEKHLPEFFTVLPSGHKAIDYMGLSAYLLELVKQLNKERKQ